MKVEAHLLPSGSWRIRVKDPVTGKRVSFTAPDQLEAETQALEFMTGRIQQAPSDRTIGDCIDEYIKVKNNILSPTTISRYKNIKRNQLSDEFLKVRLKKVTLPIVQKEINRLAGIYSAKTVKNASGLISAALRMFYPQFQYSVTLPKVQKRIRELPTADKILPLFKDTDMELIVLLGMWQGFRASEIRGLKKSDFKDGVLTINRVVVTVDGKRVEKTETKTRDSRRQLAVPPIIQKLVDEVDGEYITMRRGESIYKSFKLRVSRAGYPDMTFHDLRHLNASVMLMLGVPDKYAMERGGWATTSTLKSVYQETFSDERKNVDARIDEYFVNLYERGSTNKPAPVDTKMDTNLKTPRKFKLKRSL